LGEFRRRHRVIGKKRQRAEFHIPAFSVAPELSSPGTA
jgi:hypothetical protein